MGTDAWTALIARYRLACSACAVCSDCADRALTLGLRLLRATAWLALLALTVPIARYHFDCAYCALPLGLYWMCCFALPLGARLLRGCENRAICSLRILKRSMEKNPIGSRFRPRAPILRILKARLQAVPPLGAPVFSGIVCGY